MKTYILLFLSATIALVACNRSGSEKREEDRTGLFQRFHGKYQVLSCRSKEAVDINMDGVTDVNLMQEIPDLANTHLEVRLKTGFFFMQFWPEQYFSSNTEPLIYDTTVVINYAQQGVVRSFVFNNAISEITLLPDEGVIDPRFVRPDAILIKAGNRLEVIMHKRLFTRDGWKTVQLTTLYERYTMET